MFNLQQYINSLKETNNLNRVINNNIQEYIDNKRDLFLELGVNGTFNKASYENIKINNKKISFRYLKTDLAKRSFERYQDRSIWKYGCIFYEEEAIVILKNYDENENQNYPLQMIINKNKYKEACYYLFLLMAPDDEGKQERYEPLSGTIPRSMNSLPIKEWSVLEVEKNINNFNAVFI